MPTVNEVFGISRDVPLNYVTREYVDDTFVRALTKGKHIVVHGSSKQGKTCMRKYNLIDTDFIHVTCSNRMNLSGLHSAILKAAGYEITGTTTRTVSGEAKVQAKVSAKINFPWIGRAGVEGGGEGAVGKTKAVDSTPLELDPTDVNDIIVALGQVNSPQIIVLEDFHYLPEETQEDFAIALKSFHEDSNYIFVVVGVWLDENRLIQHNGDLTGRVISINADEWHTEQIAEVIAEGERLLGIAFNEEFKQGLKDGAFDSIWVVQESCLRACEQANIHKTCKPPVHITADAREMISKTIESSSTRYNGFLGSFSEGFMEAELEMYKWILYCVLTSSVTTLEHGISYSEIRRKINENHPSAPVNMGNITQALKSTAPLQIKRTKTRPIVLDFDQTNRRLNVVDRSFLIWLDTQDRNALLADAGLPLMNEDEKLD